MKLVFVTSAAEGAYFKNVVTEGYVPALRGINVIDTTGAGDIFGGSAVWKLLQLGKAPDTLSVEELREIASFASTAAGLSTTKSGGLSSVPAYEDVIKNLN